MLHIQQFFGSLQVSINKSYVIGAWKCNFPSFKEIMKDQRQTDGPFAGLLGWELIIE